MITKESLIEARDTINQAVLKFKQSYNRSSKVIYLIVEGKDDIPYYGSAISRYLHDEWKCRIIEANNRSKVVQAYLDIDWNKYPKKQVLFFIDRDLSDYTEDFTPIDENVYVTENYSIENDLFQVDTCERTLKYFYGLQDIEDHDLDKIIQLYNQAYINFQEHIMPIMAWILYWRKNGIPCNLDNIQIDKIFEVDRGSLKIKASMNDKTCIINYIHSKCGISYNSVNIESYVNEFIEKQGPDKFIRGKYVRNFFVMFINSMHNSSAEVLLSKRKTKTSISLGNGNAIPILCGIMRVPHALDQFIKNTCVEYMQALVA